jgi:predicted Zn-dependent protease with MMP-like domain
MIIVKDKVKAEDGILHMKLPDEFKNKVVEVVVKIEEIEKKLLVDTIKVDTRKWKFNREEIYGR